MDQRNESDIDVEENVTNSVNARFTGTNDVVATMVTLFIFTLPIIYLFVLDSSLPDWLAFLIIVYGVTTCVWLFGSGAAKTAVDIVRK